MTETTTTASQAQRTRATRGMLPSTWLGRTLRVEYAGAMGDTRETTGALLDTCPVGLIVNVAGSKTVLPFDRLVLAELVEGG